MNYKIKVEIAVYKNDDNMTDIISVTRRAETTSVTDAETAGVAIDNAVRNILTDLRGASTVVLISEEVLNSLDASLTAQSANVTPRKMHGELWRRSMADLEGKLRELALNKGPRTVLHPVTGPMVDEKDVAFAREAAALGRAEGLEEAAKLMDNDLGYGRIARAKHHDVAKFLPSKEEVLNSLDAFQRSRRGAVSSQ